MSNANPSQFVPIAIINTRETFPQMILRQNIVTQLNISYLNVIFIPATKVSILPRGAGAKNIQIFNVNISKLLSSGYRNVIKILYQISNFFLRQQARITRTTRNIRNITRPRIRFFYRKIHRLVLLTMILRRIKPNIKLTILTQTYIIPQSFQIHTIKRPITLH